MSERAAYLRDGAAIYERSFAIIRAEADLSRFSAEEADVAVRMIHACGLVEVAQHIVFGGDLVAAARGALAAGAPILCDSEMVAHGITRARLPAGNEVICTLNDPRVAALAQRTRHDAFGCGARSVARPPRRRRGRHRQCADGVVPSARPASTPARRSRPRSSAFRSASSAPRNPRTALAADPRGVPFLIVRGRMGGSAMTAAAVNALARAGL